MWGSKLLANYGSKALGVAGMATRAMGGAGRAAMYGGMMGAGWGMMSSDTSVLGGAMMGAGIGLGARYGRAGFRAANRAFGRTGQPVYGLGSAFGGGVSRRFMRDVTATRLRANQGFARVMSTLGRG